MINIKKEKVKLLIILSFLLCDKYYQKITFTLKIKCKVEKTIKIWYNKDVIVLHNVRKIKRRDTYE